ncbi:MULTISPECIES: dihydrofolate reductase family protein [unclassified Gordonia (in: high G+C Gram-positive bacteria)]
MTAFRYYTAITLDGFLADDDDNLDWLLNQPIDESGPMNHTDFITGVGALVMGATTYRWLLDHEVTDGRPWPYSVPTFLFTHGDVVAVSDTIRVVAGDPRELRTEIVSAAGDRDVWVVGGGDLAAQFADAGMLDEILVSIAPVTLGGGRPLFTAPYDLTLKSVERNSAFVCARYDVVGPRRSGVGSGDDGSGMTAPGDVSPE